MASTLVLPTPPTSSPTQCRCPTSRLPPTCFASRNFALVLATRARRPPLQPLLRPLSPPVPPRPAGPLPPRRLIAEAMAKAREARARGAVATDATSSSSRAPSSSMALHRASPADVRPLSRSALGFATALGPPGGLLSSSRRSGGRHQRLLHRFRLRTRPTPPLRRLSFRPLRRTGPGIRRV